MIVDEQGREIRIATAETTDPLKTMTVKAEWMEGRRRLEIEESAFRFFVFCKNGLTTKELTDLRSLEVGKTLVVIGNDGIKVKLTRTK